MFTRYIAAKKAPILNFYTLATQVAVLLNRDDTGLAKTVTVGDVLRTAVSSQCWKFYLRHSNLLKNATKGSRHYRTRQAMLLIKEEIEALGMYSKQDIEKLCSKAGEKILGIKDSKSLSSSQILVLSDFEISSIKAAIISDLNASLQAPVSEAPVSEAPVSEAPVVEANAEAGKKDTKKSGKSGKKGATTEQASNGAIDNLKLSDLKSSYDLPIDVALMGKFNAGLTGSVESALATGFQYTVNPHQATADFYTSTDDLLLSDTTEGGAGHLNTTELTSGVFFGPGSVDLDDFCKNAYKKPFEAVIADDENLNALVADLGLWIEVITTVLPGSKKTSTNPKTTADVVFVEIRERKDNVTAAFTEPIPWDKNTLTVACRRIAQHVRKLDKAIRKPSEIVSRAFLDASPVDEETISEIFQEVPDCEKVTLNSIDSWLLRSLKAYRV